MYPISTCDVGWIINTLVLRKKIHTFQRTTECGAQLDIDWPASGLGVTLAIFSINSVISKSHGLCITLY